jgi:hypothetical protein
LEVDIGGLCTELSSMLKKIVLVLGSNTKAIVWMHMILLDGIERTREYQFMFGRSYRGISKMTIFFFSSPDI